MFNKKILIIEDDPTMAAILEKHFTVEGYTVILAGDGEEGFQKAQQEKPDVILLDIIMPKLDGLSFLRKMRKDKSIASIPVIMHSNIEVEDKDALAIASGANAYLIKADYRLKDLDKKLQEVLL